MADEQDYTEGQSDEPQGQDPRGDLLRARPGGETDIGHVPNPGHRGEKPDSAYEGPGSADS